MTWNVTNWVAIGKTTSDVNKLFLFLLSFHLLLESEIVYHSACVVLSNKIMFKGLSLQSEYITLLSFAILCIPLCIMQKIHRESHVLVTV